MQMFRRQQSAAWMFDKKARGITGVLRSDLNCGLILAFIDSFDGLENRSYLKCPIATGIRR